MSHAWIGQLAEDFPTRAKPCICVIVGSYEKITHTGRWKAKFDGTAEVEVGPRPYDGEVVHNMAKQINVVLGKNHAKMVKQTPKGQVFKKKSVF